MIYIDPATVYLPQEGRSDHTVIVDGARIAAIAPREAAAGETADRRVFDRCAVCPGFIDLQVNGAFGHDFTADPTAIWTVAERLPRFGTTAFLPTIITSSPDTVETAIDVVRRGPPPGFRGARVLGLHLEGPFLNPEAKGAHDGRFIIPPSRSIYENWTKKFGVRMVTLAPEIPGALDAVEWLASRGVLVSIGHTRATEAEATAAFDRGARYATHLFNAMPPLHHRAPGAIGAALRDDRVTVGLIADGIHVAPTIVDLVWRLKSPWRVNLVTDAMAAMGAAPGQFRLGDAVVTVDEKSARLADGTLAGSILSTDIALKSVLSTVGAPLQEVLMTLTTVPADLLDIELGDLRAGGPADFVCLDEHLAVRATYVGGVCVFDREGAAS